MSNSAFTVTGTVNAPTSAIVRAWANFSTQGGVVTIHSSYNVVSIVYNSVGNVTVTFTTGTFNDATYAAVCTTGGGSISGSPCYVRVPEDSDPTITTIRVQICGSTGAPSEAPYCSMICMGN